ncbi:MAG TPA: peptidoglycan DD-metalloendopeptidase family protein [Mariprofundaceae bacterium]|nr:peptidoglycan DD-metalloendopeptidase family protein [Mariprofundaceae bacterium]
MSSCSSLLLALLMLFAGVIDAGAGQTVQGEDVARQNAQSKIERIKAERQRLAKIRQGLESKLGALGKELKHLDQALIKARKASEEARADVQQANERLADLSGQKKLLQKKIDILHERLQDEAVAAWQRSSRSSLWLGVLTGVPVSDIPHRRYLLNTVMQSQADDRRQYQESVASLRNVEMALIRQRDQLVELSEVKRKAEQVLAERVEAKRSVVQGLQRDVQSKKQQEVRLLGEQKALLDLIDNLGKGLLAIDQPKQGKPIRKRKGRLKWPLQGKIVASFGSHPVAGRQALKGVQLKPGKTRQVKAMAAGQVRYADWFGGYGLMTIVDYGDGVIGVYAHNDALFAQLGDWVEEGDVLAEAGSTGWVSNVALYFEIRDNGAAVNPKRWCRR